MGCRSEGADGAPLRRPPAATDPATAAGSNSASSITTTSIIDTPGNTAIPQITGMPQPGQALTAVSGSWTFSPTSTEFKWLIDGAPISGEISNTYLVQAADEGHTISVAETATNDAGSTTATSAGVVISASSYTTTDFAPSSGFSVTAIAQQPDGTWDVTMTRACFDPPRHRRPAPRPGRDHSAALCGRIGGSW